MPPEAFDVDDIDQGPQGGLNFKPYIRIILRNAWLVALFTALFGAAGYFKMVSADPIYTSGFRVLVEPVTADARLTDPTALARDGGVPRENRLDYETQLEILLSPGITRGIVEQVQTQYPAFNIATLLPNLTIEREGNTKILSVGYSGYDPDLVLFTTQTLAEKYLQYSLEERRTRIGEGIRFIEEQLPELQTRVTTLEEQLENLQQTYSLINPEAESAAISDQLQALSGTQIDIQQELQAQRALYVNLQEQLELSPDQAIAASVLSENPGYQAILQELQTINTQIALESARFSESSPVVRSLRERQANLASLLNEEAGRIVGPVLADETNNEQVLAFQNTIRQGLTQQMVETVNQIRMLETRNEEISAATAVLEEQLSQFPSITRRYLDLQRDLEISTRTLEQLLTERETLRVESAQNEVPWEILSEPGLAWDENGNPVPEEADPKFFLAGIVGGAGVGVGLAILLEKIRNIFYVPDDVVDETKLPLLGIVPTCRQLKRSPLVQAIDPNELTSRESASIARFVESFSALYAGVRFLASDAPLHSLAVTAASPGDGKSIVALHLAQTIAAMGQRVLIVDANLRNPCLHRWLKLPNSKGLSDVLQPHHLEPDDVIQRSPYTENLFVLTTGTVTPESPKLLASPRMDIVGRQLHTLFDLVIYDAPHITGIMDTTFLASHTSSLLMVVSLKQTRQSAVRDALNDAEKYGIPILGVAVNRSQPFSKYTPTTITLAEDEEEYEEYDEIDDEDEKPVENPVSSRGKSL